MQVQWQRAGEKRIIFTVLFFSVRGIFRKPHKHLCPFFRKSGGIRAILRHRDMAQQHLTAVCRIVAQEPQSLGIEMIGVHGSCVLREIGGQTTRGGAEHPFGNREIRLEPSVPRSGTRLDMDPTDTFLLLRKRYDIPQPPFSRTIARHSPCTAAFCSLISLAQIGANIPFKP